MNADFVALIPIVYALVETAEKFGLKRKIAHVCAIPLGILVCYVGLGNKNLINCLFYGILVGLGAIGSCDTICNIAEIVKPKKS